MARPPVQLAHDPLVAEIGKEKHVRDGAIDKTRPGDSEAPDAPRAAERREDRFAQRADSLGEPRVLERGLDAGRVMQRDLRAGRIKALQETPGPARGGRPSRSCV